jgi:hypothetical protein
MYGMPTRASKLKEAEMTNSLAARIVAQTTGQEPPRVKNAAAVALGKLGGSKGGMARAAKLSPEERARIASLAARKRWSKKS